MLVRCWHRSCLLAYASVRVVPVATPERELQATSAAVRFDQQRQSATIAAHVRWPTGAEAPGGQQDLGGSRAAAPRMVAQGAALTTPGASMRPVLPGRRTLWTSWLVVAGAHARTGAARCWAS
jgi:hypothetical protein